MKKTVSYLQRGFTLVELLIVVIILALLAAIVVPQFSATTDDARASSLDTNLANMRAAIDLYYQQHGEYPSRNASTDSGGNCPAAATDADHAADSANAFIYQMAYFTNADGAACSQNAGGLFPFGPYLKKPILPANPITNNDNLAIVTTGDLELSGANPALGWRFDNRSGKFIADDSVNVDADGNTWDQH